MNTRNTLLNCRVECRWITICTVEGVCANVHLNIDCILIYICLYRCMCVCWLHGNFLNFIFHETCNFLILKFSIRGFLFGVIKRRRLFFCSFSRPFIFLFSSLKNRLRFVYYRLSFSATNWNVGGKKRRAEVEEKFEPFFARM